MIEVTRILLALAMVLALALPAGASATCHHHRIGRHHKHACVRVHHHKRHAPVRVVAARPPSPPTAAPRPAPPITEVGNVPGCAFGATDPRPYLAAYGATALRIVVKEGRGENPLPCIQTAVGEGFRVQVALEWDNHDAPAQVAAFVRGELNAYGPYLWAVSLGNEQELALGQESLASTPEQYAADWRAAEPVVAAVTPNAIRVAGDVNPGGMPFLQRAVANGLPGVQALGAHPYVCGGCMDPQQFVAWARAVGLPAWFDEGLLGPHSWGSDVPVSVMAGAQVVGTWWNGDVLA